MVNSIFIRILGLHVIPFLILSPISQAQSSATLALEILKSVDNYQKSLSAPTGKSAPQSVSDVWELRYPSEGQGKLVRHAWSQHKTSLSAPWDLSNATVYNLHMSHGRLAIVRLDDLAAPQAALLALLKTASGWQVVTDARTTPACLSRNSTFAQQGEHEAVLTVLHAYYDAVTQEEPAKLDGVFHPHWQMKNHEKLAVVSEGIVPFKARLQGDQHVTYSDDREVADIQVLYHCWAQVRVDKPTSGGSTFFFFVKENGQWWITDKFWTVPLQ